MTINPLAIDKFSHIPIVEIFYSLQGEGPFMGQPSLFIRLAGCPPPLCPWCDTHFAQDPQQGRDYSPEQILHSLEQCLSLHAREFKFADKAKPLVVITGGEPFWRWQPVHSQLIATLLERGFLIQIETSGKVPITAHEGTIIVASPKFLLQQWQFLPENIPLSHFYKFVVFSARQLPAILDFIQQHSLQAQQVYLMPGGQHQQEIIERSKWVAKAAMRYNLNFSARLHILLGLR